MVALTRHHQKVSVLKLFIEKIEWDSKKASPAFHLEI